MCEYLLSITIVPFPLFTLSFYPLVVSHRRKEPFRTNYTYKLVYYNIIYYYICALDYISPPLRADFVGPEIA